VAKAHPGVSARLKGEKDSAQFSSAGSKTRLPTFPGTEFPDLAFLQENFVESCALAAPALRNAFSGVRHAVWTQDTTKPACMGVFLESAGGYLLAVAVSGPQLAQEVVGELGTDARLGTLPVPAVTAFSRFFPNGEDVRIARADGRLRFSGDSGTLTVSTLTEPFPEYRQVIPRDSPIVLRVDRQELLSAVARVRLVHRDPANGVAPAAFTLSADAVEIHTESLDGSADEYVRASAEGLSPSLRVGFNTAQLTDLLKSLTAETAVAELQAPERATLWRDEGGVGLRLLMPMRLTF
jgi:DNA polymerase-3 subunit beta